MIRRIVMTAVKYGAKLPFEPQLERFTFLTQLRALLLRHEIDCVLDVGANGGQFGRALRDVGYDGWIVSFEPNPVAFSRLQKCCDERWLAQNLALGRTPGQMTLIVHEEDDTMSSFREAFNQSVPTHTVQVPVARLDTVLPDVVAATRIRRAMLKCDTQGFDLEVVAGGGDALRDIPLLLSELAVCPFYEGMPIMHEALATYAGLGFGLRALHPVGRLPDGQVIEYDGFFDRRES